ncbi:MAG: threonine/serine dehydratase [Bacteroidota bacterium]
MHKVHTVPQRSDIEHAHAVIKPYIHRTPVLSSQSINKITGIELFFKCENFQKIGAFKIRGGTCAALALSDEEKQNGIATHSSGNHAQAVALSAQRLGLKAYIVMPSNAPPVKIAATKGYGAEVTFCDPTLEARESTLAQVVARTGATEIHPYNNYNIITGAATAAKELIEDTEGLDIILAPIGGGGLMSGTALSTRYFLPGAEVIGAEPENVDDAFRSFKAGAMLYNTTTDTIADGLRTNLGEKTFDIILRYVDDIITVSEKEIAEAMRLLWERMKIVVEPSSAVPFAAVLKSKDRFTGKRIGIILSGGNVNLNDLPF